MVLEKSLRNACNFCMNPAYLSFVLDVLTVPSLLNGIRLSTVVSLHATPTKVCMKGLRAIRTRAEFYRQKIHYSFTLIILLFRYDFFLVSQSVRQGTVSPTHFNVIEDNSGLKPDHLQRLSYKLTHLYYNWPVSEIIKIQ